MYNYFMLIGFVVNDLDLREVGDGKKVVNIRLAVRREFQNPDGQYDADFINVVLWDFLADHAYKHVKKGSRIALKGRIHPRKDESNDRVVYTNDLYADRLIFLGENEAKDILELEEAKD
ncbi:MAG: single-stranded DNA-binding protein [Acholeplasmatales bacterium]|nr:single-stranded DNA-binding protein [Acholeplasmatales bacterium]